MLLARGGALGRVHLNRPRVLNALTLDMIRTMQAALDEWRDDPEVRTVVLTGEGERGFCAGGDIRFVWEMATTEPGWVLELWREEYLLNLAIATYPKPVVAIADGITMGGGIGLAGHAAHRLITPRSSLAMPEVRIGLAPDVGGLLLLSRAPGELGTHLALTGEPADASTSLTIGWADAVVRTESIPAILHALAVRPPHDVVPAFSVATDQQPVPEWITRCYAADDIETILERLDVESTPQAHSAASLIRSGSPMALAVTLAGLRRARDLNLAECLLQDYRMSSRFLQRADLVEGIRARIVDKDGAPRWLPAEAGDVTGPDVQEFFLPAEHEEAWLDTLTTVWTGHTVTMHDADTERSLETMRSAKLTATGSLDVADGQTTHLASGEVEITVTYCGVCGSDLHMVHAAEHLVGHVLGHEFTGVLSAVDPAVADEWQKGDRVAVRPIADCGVCEACRSGGVCLPGLMAGPGLGRPGGLAESVAVPATMLFRLPDSISDKAAAIAEPLAVAVRGVERSTAAPDDAVCVMGAGPIGYMTVVVLQARGVSNILVVEPNVSRAKKVSELGVATCEPDGAAEAAERVLGGPPRVVVDCTGHPSGGTLGIALLPQNGCLAVVGVTSTPVAADFMSVTTKELTIVGSLAYSKENFEEALAHLAAGRIPVDRVVTSVRALDDADAVVQELASGQTNDIKVLIQP